ncbi:hypothetical protein [Bifidobacterium apri]|uniref:hypothetical protein n=1 Tax=Bifidobacterium apri TaxID=1769423 RepID=UPI003995704F
MDASATPSTVQPVWSSNDTNVATVSNSGVITARANGTTMVIVQAGNKSIRFRVTVQDTDQNKTSSTSITPKKTGPATSTSTIRPMTARGRR